MRVMSIVKTTLPGRVSDAVVGFEAAGPARFRVDDALTLQLHIHHFILGGSEGPRIETSYFGAPAAAAVAVVGVERWGQEWLDLLRSVGTPRPIRFDDAPFPPRENLLWIAQNTPRPGPWLAAETPTDAEAGGLGEDLGDPVIAALFRERVARGEQVS